MHERRVRAGGLKVDHGRERLVVDDHCAGSVGGLVARARDDDGDGVARVRRLLDRDRQVQRRLHLGGDRPGARQASGKGVAQVRARVGSSDARLAPGLAEVDRADRGVGVGAPDEGKVQGTGDGEVVHVAGFAREQLRVLAANPPGAEQARALPGRRRHGGVDGGHRAGAQLWRSGARAAAKAACTMLW